MGLRWMSPVIGLLLLCSSAALRANDGVPTEAEKLIAIPEGRFGGAYPVVPSQYLAGPGGELPPPPAAASDRNLIYVEPACDPRDLVYRNSNWNIGLDIIPTQSQLTRAEFGPWPDDGALALRLNLGYEDETGYGFRARLWAFGQDVAAPADVDLFASTLDMDLYKRLFINDTELVFGGGPASGHLEFQLPDDSYSRFNGGGISMFAEGFQPLHRFECTDLGFVGRARFTLLEGDWRDTTGTVIPSTNHDSLSIAELAWGLELRRRVGRMQDHYWLVDVLFEHQRWESPWMAHYIGSDVAFTGIDVNFGLAW